jgi:hypothetical protein
MMSRAKRQQVGRPDEVDPAAEHVGRDREADERGVAAVAAAHDAHAVVRGAPC